MKVRYQKIVIPETVTGQQVTMYAIEIQLEWYMKYGILAKNGQIMLFKSRFEAMKYMLNDFKNDEEKVLLLPRFKYDTVFAISLVIIVISSFSLLLKILS